MHQHKGLLPLLLTALNSAPMVPAQNVHTDTIRLIIYASQLTGTVNLGTTKLEDVLNAIVNSN